MHGVDCTVRSSGELVSGCHHCAGQTYERFNGERPPYSQQISECEAGCSLASPPRRVWSCLRARVVLSERMSSTIREERAKRGGLQLQLQRLDCRARWPARSGKSAVPAWHGSEREQDQTTSCRGSVSFLCGHPVDVHH